jgi:hypothetical protein
VYQYSFDPPPATTAEPTLDVTTVDDVDVVLIEETRKWAADLTAIQYADHVEHIVAQLWPEYFLECEDWRAALDAWVQDQRAAEEPAPGGASNTSCNHVSRGRLTTDIAVTQAALDRIDGEVVAERTIVHRWTDSKLGVQDNSGDGKRAFVPVWGPSAEGTANYIDRASNTWTDTGADDHGTVVEMALIDRENWPRGVIAAGEDWGRGVTHLQRLGFDVPVWTPDATTEGYREMPWWSVRRAAVVLNVVDEDEVISNPAPDDETSFGLPSREIFNRALEAIEAVGLVHNREPFLGGD